MDITLIRSVYRNEPREKFIRTWNTPRPSKIFIVGLSVLDAILVLDMNPGSLLQINSTSTQVDIIRTSKVDKGLGIQRSELTLSHGILDTHESHRMLTNIM